MPQEHLTSPQGRKEWHAQRLAKATQSFDAHARASQTRAQDARTNSKSAQRSSKHSGPHYGGACTVGTQIISGTVDPTKETFMGLLPTMPSKRGAHKRYVPSSWHIRLGVGGAAGLLLLLFNLTLPLGKQLCSVDLL
jgi:hypothetical protein